MEKEKQPAQGIVRTGRGEQQPADEDRAQRDSGHETHATPNDKPELRPGSLPKSSGHS